MSESQKQTSPFVVHKCPICGKSFIPAAMHIYRKNGNAFCGWNCYLKSDTVQRPKRWGEKIVVITDTNGTLIGEFGTGAATEFIGCTKHAIYDACKQGTPIFNKYYVRYKK